MSKKKSKKKSKSEKQLTNTLLAFAIIDLLTQVVKMLSKILE